MDISELIPGIFAIAVMGSLIYAINKTK